MTRNHLALWRVLLNRKVLLTRVDRGSFRFDLNFMFMTDFIFFLPSQISTQATCLQKLPNLPWLLLRCSWNLRLPFVFFLVETYFCLFPCSPSALLQRTHPSLHSLPQTDSWCVTVCSTRSLMYLWTSLGRSENCFWTQIVYNDWPHRPISTHSLPSCLRQPNQNGRLFAWLWVWDCN